MGSGEGGNPLARHGGLSYLKIPARDVKASAEFYRALLGWSIDPRGDDDIRFADTAGLLIGAWVQGAACNESGLLPYFYVDSLASAVARVREHGGEVVEAPRPEGDVQVARVRDPAGNIIGLWQFGGQ